MISPGSPEAKGHVSEEFSPDMSKYYVVEERPLKQALIHRYATNKLTTFLPTAWRVHKNGIDWEQVMAIWKESR